MSFLRYIANMGHAACWTSLMCTAGVTVYGITGSRLTFHRMTHFWAQGLARGWGMRVVTHGADQLNPAGTYVFVANHLSHVDIVALFVALPVHVGFLAKQELRRVPFLGAAMVAGGHVFIDRARHENAVKALGEAAAQVRQGASLVVFPEGTRGDADAIQPFKKGGFHLAREASVPVVPVGLRGTRQIMARKDWAMRPGEVHVHIGAPMDPNGFPDATALSEEARKQVATLAAMPPSNGDRA